MRAQPTDPPGLPCGQYLVCIVGAAALASFGVFVGLVWWAGRHLAVDAAG